MDNPKKNKNVIGYLLRGEGDKPFERFEEVPSVRGLGGCAGHARYSDASKGAIYKKKSNAMKIAMYRLKTGEKIDILELTFDSPPRVVDTVICEDVPYGYA